MGEMADVKIQDPACHLRRIEGGEELCERQYFKGRKNDGKPARDRVPSGETSAGNAYQRRCVLQGEQSFQIFVEKKAESAIFVGHK